MLELKLGLAFRPEAILAFPLLLQLFLLQNTHTRC
jgi:hypothetical protein